MQNIKFTLIDKTLKGKNIRLTGIHKLIPETVIIPQTELDTENLSKDALELLSVFDLDRLAIERAENEGLKNFDNSPI